MLSTPIVCALHHPAWRGRAHVVGSHVCKTTQERIYAVMSASTHRVVFVSEAYLRRIEIRGSHA